MGASAGKPAGPGGRVAVRSPTDGADRYMVPFEFEQTREETYEFRVADRSSVLYIFECLHRFNWDWRLFPVPGGRPADAPGATAPLAPGVPPLHLLQVANRAEMKPGVQILSPHPHAARRATSRPGGAHGANGEGVVGAGGALVTELVPRGAASWRFACGEVRFHWRRPGSKEERRTRQALLCFRTAADDVAGDVAAPQELELVAALEERPLGPRRRPAGALWVAEDFCPPAGDRWWLFELLVVTGVSAMQLTACERAAQQAEVVRRQMANRQSVHLGRAIGAI